MNESWHAKIKMHKAEFIKEEIYWCNWCDGNKVNSNDPKTGSFFSQFGSTWNVAAQKCNNDYVQVIFAMCIDCMNDNPMTDPWRNDLDHPIDPFSYPGDKDYDI